MPPRRHSRSARCLTVARATGRHRCGERGQNRPRPPAPRRSCRPISRRLWLGSRLRHPDRSVCCCPGRPATQRGPVIVHVPVQPPPACHPPPVCDSAPPHQGGPRSLGLRGRAGHRRIAHLACARSSLCPFIGVRPRADSLVFSWRSEDGGRAYVRAGTNLLLPVYPQPLRLRKYRLGLISGQRALSPITFQPARSRQVAHSTAWHHVLTCCTATIASSHIMCLDRDSSR